MSHAESSAAASAVPPAPAVPRRAWQALVVLLAGMFIALLDTTIVNVALPSIRTSIDASEATLSWIISGYALAFGLALIPAGRIGDRIGHKWVFVTGVALFTVASLACGLSQDDLQLVVSRVVQGLAGGMYVPAVTAYIQLLFPFRMRGKAFGIMGAVIGVSTALGPIIGGLIIEAFGAEEGWRLVFGVNLPIGIATVIAAAVLLPGQRESAAVAAAATGGAGARGPAGAAGADARGGAGADARGGAGADVTKAGARDGAGADVIRAGARGGADADVTRAGARGGSGADATRASARDGAGATASDARGGVGSGATAAGAHGGAGAAAGGAAGAASGGRPAGGKAGLDWVGLVLVSAGLVALLVPLIEGEDEGWPVWTFVSLGVGVLLLVGFGAWEVAYSKRDRTPLVPPRLYRHASFTGGTILALVYFAAFTSIFFTISLLWQAGLGHTALESGLVSIPFAIGSIIGSSQSARLAQRLGRTVLIIGTAAVAVGLAWVFVVLLLVPAADLTNWQLLVPLFIAGVGNGLFIAPNAQFIVATVDRADAGAASGVISAMQRVGSAVGIAVIGSVFFGTLVVSGPSADALATGFASSSAAAMAVSVGFSVLAFLLVFALPRRTGVGGPPGAGAGASG